MKPTVFIHTNHKQIVGAMVSAHSMRRNSRHADSFDVRIIHTKDYPLLREMEGRSYLMDGAQRSWRYDDLQSFTPLRFMPPELMGYGGRAVVVDPDVFAVGDIWELLSRDMDGKGQSCAGPAPAPRSSVDSGHQRDAARLRQAHALALGGTVRGRCSPASATTCSGSALQA